MRTFIFSLICLIAICNSHEAMASTKPHLLELLPDDFNLIKVITTKDAEVRDLVKWQDKNGTNYIVILESNKGKRGIDYESYLYAFMYRKIEKTYELIWKIFDFAKDGTSSVHYRANTLSIMDLDGDGLAETGFFYSIYKDGLDPNPLKYMLHSKGKKIAIRGLIPKHEDDVKLYQKNIDKAYNAFPDSFKSYASDKWDQFAKVEFDTFNISFPKK